MFIIYIYIYIYHIICIYIYIYHIIYMYIYTSYIGDKFFRIHAIEPTPKRNERRFLEPNK